MRIWHMISVFKISHPLISVSLIQLQIGVEFEASTRMQDTTTSFGYQLDLPKANLLFKGKLKKKKTTNTSIAT